MDFKNIRPISTIMAAFSRKTGKVKNITEEEELCKRGYQVGVTLGTGAFGKVKCAFSDKYGMTVAVKIINREKISTDNVLNKFLSRELEAMKKIHHPNIIQLIDVMQFNGKLYMVLEMADNGDLLQYIKRKRYLDEDQARHLFYQLCSAVSYLHQIDIIHRDLKCENILLDVQNNIKLSDFGFCRTLSSDELSHTYCGSAAYAAPEILQGIPYAGPPYDIWSLGVVLYIMVSGSMPFDQTKVSKMIERQKNHEFDLSELTISDEAKDVIYGMLEPDIKKRATMSEVYESPWLKPYMSDFIKFEAEMREKSITMMFPATSDRDNSARLPETSSGLGVPPGGESSKPSDQTATPKPNKETPETREPCQPSKCTFI